jgi:hypothetical protein
MGVRIQIIEHELVREGSSLVRIGPQIHIPIGTYNLPPDHGQLTGVVQSPGGVDLVLGPLRDQELCHLAGGAAIPIDEVPIFTPLRRADDSVAAAIGVVQDTLRGAGQFPRRISKVTTGSRVEALPITGLGTIDAAVSTPPGQLAAMDYELAGTGIADQVSAVIPEAFAGLALEEGSITLLETCDQIVAAPGGHALTERIADIGPLATTAVRLANRVWPTHPTSAVRRTAQPLLADLPVGAAVGSTRGRASTLAVRITKSIWICARTALNLAATAIIPGATNFIIAGRNAVHAIRELVKWRRAGAAVIVVVDVLVSAKRATSLRIPIPGTCPAIVANIDPIQQAGTASRRRIPVAHAAALGLGL